MRVDAHIPVAGWLMFDTPVGPCGLAWTADARLAGAQLPGADEAVSLARMQRRFGREAGPVAPPPVVTGWINRLRLVMAAGSADTLADIPVADDGLPDFHRRVWAMARGITPGHTRSYGELAAALGAPGAARAVGQALGANPFAPFVPCHRVLAAGGGSGGFSAPGGRSTKLRLLELEGARFEWQPGQPGLF